MGRSKTNSTRGRGARQSAELPPGKVWDQQSGPDEYDGRENTAAGSSGGLTGKWNDFGKSRPGVFLTREILRPPKR